jgi:CheY-like chemotaxis protein
MIDAPSATIRTWEERYKLVVPERSLGGHRLYTREQVEQLRFVKSQLDRGARPATAHRLLAEQLEQGRVRFFEDKGRDVPRLLILLVERDPYAASFEEYFLMTEGFEVELVFDSEEAEKKAAELSPNVIVVELLVGGGTGAELCRRLKAQGAACLLAISSLDARDDALAAGADAFLRKPFDPLQLVSAAKDLLGASAYLGGRARFAP